MNIQGNQVSDPILLLLSLKEDTSAATECDQPEGKHRKTLGWRLPASDLSCHARKGLGTVSTYSDPCATPSVVMRLERR